MLEPGLSGVAVTLTDDSGTSITGTTAADGTVTLNPAGTALAGGKYRVQALNPKPGIFFSAFAARDTFFLGFLLEVFHRSGRRGLLVGIGFVGSGKGRCVTHNSAVPRTVREPANVAAPCALAAQRRYGR